MAKKKKSSKKPSYVTANEKANRDIEKALAALGAVSASYKPVKIKMPDYTSVYKNLKGNPGMYKMTPIDWSNFGEGYNGTELKKKSKSKKHSGIKAPDLWGVLSGTLGLPGGVVTDWTSDLIKDAKHFNPKHPFKTGAAILSDINPATAIAQVGMRMGKHGIKEQMKDWKDGHLSWGDIPGVGFLHGADKGFKRGEDIMGQFGVKNRWGKIGGGIGIDIALDPLTYLTGGASTASKLSKAKEVEKLAELSKAMKLEKKVKNIEELKDVTRAKLKKKYPHMSEHIIEKRVVKLADEVKAAKAATYNANINKWGVSVPFSNKMTAAVGNISKKSLVYRSEAKLGESGLTHLAEDLIGKVAETGAKRDKVIAAVKKLYGVHKLEDLTKTHFSDLTNRLTPVLKQIEKGALPDAKIVENMVDKHMPNEIFDIATKKARPNETLTYAKTTVDDILKSIDPVVVNKVAPLLHGLGDVNDIRKLAPDAVKMFGEFAPKILRTVKGKTAKQVEETYKHLAEQLSHVTHTGTIAQDAPIPYKELQRVVEMFKNGDEATNAMKVGRELSKAFDRPMTEMNNAKTGFEHWLDKKNPFDPRTLRTGNKFVDSMGEHIADAQSQKVGEMAKYDKPLNAIKSFIKKNKVSQDDMMAAIYHLEGKAPEQMKNFTPSSKQKQLAELIKPLLDRMAKDEKAAGVLTHTRKNYFPHIVNRDAEELQKIKEFKDRHGSLNGLSKANKNSKSRTSFDTLADRDNYVMELEKDIQKATDPAEREALIEQQKRVADLFDTDVVSALTRRVKEGVRAKAIKDMQGKLSKFGMMATDPKDITEIRGLKKLSKGEAKKLGLGEGEHYMHPDVLEGMKRVDDIFTNQGMNKFVRHLNAFTDVWRSLVTTYKLSHYRNNIIGNTINNLAAGIGVSDYKTAGKLLNGYRKGTLTPGQMKIMDKAFKHNVLSGGFTTDMSRQSFHFDTPTKLEKFAEKAARNKVGKGLRHSGEKVDDYFRLANFVNGLGKFNDVGKAARQVREYLFNYNEMTNADRHMRTLVPFWNWTKRNVPLQVKVLLENPKVAMNVERFKDLFNEGQPGEDWQKQAGIKIPGTNSYTSLPSPTDDLNQVLNPLSLESSMNPAIKSLLELSLNKQFFTKKPISYGTDTVQAKDVPNYLAHQLGIFGNIADIMSGKKSVGKAVGDSIFPTYGIQK